MNTRICIHIFTSTYMNTHTPLSLPLHHTTHTHRREIGVRLGNNMTGCRFVTGASTSFKLDNPNQAKSTKIKPCKRSGEYQKYQGERGRKNNPEISMTLFPEKITLHLEGHFLSVFCTLWWVHTHLGILTSSPTAGCCWMQLFDLSCTSYFLLKNRWKTALTSPGQ